MPSVLLVGHSHIDALIAGHADPASPTGLALHVVHGRDAAYAPWAQWVDGAIVVNPALGSSIADTIGRLRPEVVAVSVDGSQHLLMIDNRRRFDFVLPGHEDLPLEPDAEIVPYDLMREVFGHEQRNVLRLLSAVRDLASVPVVFPSVPPPPEFIGAHMPKMREAMLEAGSPGVAVRVRLWTLYMDVVREYCDGIGVTFLPPPPGTQGTYGHLLPEYDGDGLHANGAYGAKVLHQIVAVGAQVAGIYAAGAHAA